jgi:quercetin dioxygenase-like cupin family protein
MAKVEHLDFAKPDETRVFEHGRMDILKTASGVVGRLTIEPGWRWSNDVKPIAGTEWCQAPHFAYHVAGTLHVQMADGTEFDVRPGNLVRIPPGHDAWVVGDEPVVEVDFNGATDYAKR